MTGWEIKAIEDTFGEVGTALIAVARLIFPEHDATSEAYKAFQYAYDHFQPERKKPFEDYCKETTWYLCLNERRSRKKYTDRNKQYPVVDGQFEELIPDLREAPEEIVLPNFLMSFAYSPVTRDHDAKYVVTYVLNPPKKIKQIVQDSITKPNCTKQVRQIWRRVLTNHLLKKRWKMDRIEGAFARVEEYVKFHYPARITRLKG